MNIIEAIIADVDNKATVEAISAAREGVTIHLTESMAHHVLDVLGMRVDDTQQMLDEARAQVAPRPFDGDWDAELDDDNEVGLLIVAMNHRMARDAYQMWSQQVMDVAFPEDDEDDEDEDDE